MTREEKILSAIDPATQLGLEIGPLNRPIVTCQMGKIRYVDHASTEELKQKYAEDSNVDIDQIVKVDYVWGEKQLPQLAGDEAPFDYVVASHVIEHVPDLIGWLKEIHAVLKPGGILTLAIPDKRYCFDYFRQPTEPAQVVEAYLQGNRKPTPRQIFEHLSQVAFWQGQLGWSHEVEASELTRLYTDRQAWEVAYQASIDNQYHDVHCWVFTPRTFFQLLRTLIDINLVDFKVAEYYDTTGLEFYISLEAMDLTKHPDDRKAIQLESLPTIDRDRPQIAPLEPQSILEDERVQSLLVELESEREMSKLAHLRIGEHQETIQRLRKRVKNLKIKLEDSENQIKAMKTSKFWKLRSQWLKLKQLLGLNETGSNAR
ncbi:methyltransferase domain-containing protein [Leptolyngbya sp. FACHB-711]|uniref:methyltransferase domain-containing protein n=1 Tax=unclassified Leptolyngbya TaxID=2650499 RepID=UPI00168301E3|nr:methyltransferase domain-containing protein [Leptolyngbya sp. FACHB-711]MBD1852264.1 methyltransferase domain-containing protein [Cyanobacteria bacterium FACHB-502]MBD2024949.1 methyltransferase domain-containing protein [Leptolyngbya sp. FACHB-711]